MRNPRCYYSADIETFLRQSDTEIFGIICSNASNHKLILQQSNAWKDEIRILKAQLNRYAEGRIIIEYIIPRMGKRADIVFLHKNIVFCWNLNAESLSTRQVHITRCMTTRSICKTFRKKAAINSLCLLS